ncbi:hypothetical protein K440DRAFT_599976 [Wilcoxina mikolae CBS 423.85]|nr:hypothetical protein K440DRAFT_599976 [Wilcoxina mikolae CBS 423.85]
MVSLFIFHIARPSFAALKLRSCRSLTVYRYFNGSTRHGNDPEVLKKGKVSILSKHKENSTEEPHWHEELASDAEAFVKAQRDEIDASEESIAKLQRNTKDISSKKR